VKVTHIPVGKPGDFQMMVAISRDGKNLYVSNSTSSDGGRLQVIDTGTGLVTATFPIFTDLAGGGLAVTPDGAHVYFTPGLVDGPVKVIDAVHGTVTHSITTGRKPMHVAMNPNGKHAYVSNAGDGTVAVVDTTTKAVTATITVGDPLEAGTGVGAGPLAISPNGKSLWVLSTFFTTNGKVSEIDIASKAVVATVTVGRDPFGIAVSPSGTRAYVSNNGSGTVSVIDTATKAVVATVPVGSDPYGVAVSTDNKRAFVTHLNTGSTASEDTVSVINATNNTFEATVTIGAEPSAGSGYVVVDPGGPHVYAAPGMDGTVSVICTA
jgi:YVTN family beta-propeller protein